MNIFGIYKEVIVWEKDVDFSVEYRIRTYRFIHTYFYYEPYDLNMNDDMRENETTRKTVFLSQRKTMESWLVGWMVGWLVDGFLFMLMPTM